MSYTRTALNIHSVWEINSIWCEVQRYLAHIIIWDVLEVKEMVIFTVIIWIFVIINYRTSPARKSLRFRSELLYRRSAQTQPETGLNFWSPLPSTLNFINATALFGILSTTRRCSARSSSTWRGRKGSNKFPTSIPIGRRQSKLRTCNGHFHHGLQLQQCHWSVKREITGNWLRACHRHVSALDDGDGQRYTIILYFSCG